MKSYAIVIGNNHHNTLGVLRSLGEQRVICKLVLTGKENGNFVAYSKYVDQCYSFTEEAHDIIQLINKIAMENEGRAVLFPLSDTLASEIDSKRNQLNENIIAPHANGCIEQYLDKYYMASCAERCGICIPRHITQNLDEKIVWNIYPAIVKPLKSKDGRKGDINIVHNINELHKTLHHLKLLSYESVLVEEFISSLDSYMVEILGNVKKDGSIEIPCIMEKIREYPVGAGSTSYARLTQVKEHINLDTIKNMITTTGYYGLFDIEIMFNEGKFYFIEFNFRNGAPSYALTSAGYNIVYDWYANAIGEAYNGLLAHDDYYLMCEHKDVLHVVNKDLSLKKWISDYYRTDVFLMRNRHDKKPQLHFIIPFLLRSGRFTLNKIRKIMRKY